MKIIRNKIIAGSHEKPIVLDVFFEDNGKQKPVVIFTHGFKGFKDWGTFNLIAEKFAHHGFVFVKFNLSHNGTTPEQPEDFNDLEAFANNNFCIELNDLGCVINWLLEEKEDVPAREFDGKKLYLLGHSRGGGISILKANEDERVKKLATWSSVNEFGKFWSEDFMKEWKEEGVQYVHNSRTGQQMPMYYQIYENLEENIDRLHIPTAAKNLKIPFLIVHGTDDESVPYQTGEKLKEWATHAQLLTIRGGDHTFGAKHPWEGDNLPADSEHVVEETIRFFQKD